MGGKDGTYYSIDPRTGALRWSTNVVFGGSAGGFIGTTAYDGVHVFGSTAIGDLTQPTVCDPSNPVDTRFQEPSAHAFNVQTGAVAWQASGSTSFAPTTVSGGMTLNCLALSAGVLVRSSTNGALIIRLPLSVPCWSGVATVGDALVLGTGTSYAGSPDGVVAFTPGGAAPVVPNS